MKSRTAQIWTGTEMMESFRKKFRGKDLEEVCWKVRRAFPGISFKYLPELSRPGMYLHGIDETGTLQVMVRNL